MKRSIIRITYLFSIACFVSFHLVGQTYSEYENLKEKYKDESIVQLLNRRNCTFEIVKGQLEVYETIEEKYIFFKNNMGETFDLSIYTSDFYELVDFEANSYVLEKEKYKKFPVKSYIEKSNSDYSSFYDDQKELVFVYPGVAEGTVVELKQRLKVKEPRLLKTVYINWVYPIQDLDISFTCSKDINLELLSFNFDENTGAVEKSETGKETVYSLKMKDIKGTILEKGAPDIRYYLPHIVPIVRNYSYKGKTINVLSDNNSLYKWYYTFIDESKRDIETTDIKKLADSIVQGCVTDLCKVEHLYYWVQKNIKYIAFEYGLGGFIPRKPDEILKNRYGDCKDNTSLLHELANQVGIKTYFTWIGTNDIPYSYSEVSSPASDNHMILTYIGEDSSYYFLDATSRYNNINYPTSFIQGKEALIGVNETDFIIKKVPMMPANRSVYIDSINLRLEDKVLKGDANLYLSGYQYVEGMYNLNNSDGEAIRNYLKNLLRKGSNKFLLGDYVLPDVEDIDTMMSLPYTFELPNYVQSAADEMYINLNLNKDMLSLKLEKDRKFPVAFEYLRSLSNRFVLTVPDGYKIGALPETSHYYDDMFDFTIKYELAGNQVVYSHELNLRSEIIYPKDFDKWNGLLKALEKAYKQTIMLKQIDK